MLAPATHSTGGLRYYLALPFEPCELRGSESINDAWTRCDSKARAEADLIMRLYNGALESRVPTRGIEPDRFDLALVLTPVPGPPGGQSCHGGQRSTGAGIGERLGDGSASTAGQEMAHCLGEVHSGSPSWDHGAHSTNFTIALPAGVKAVNMRTQQDVDTPESMMWPVALGNESGFFEAFEWNDVRAAITSGRGLLARSDSVHRQVLAAANAVQPQSQTRTPMFAIMGTVNRSGKLAMEYSGMVEPLHPHVATADETSDYAVAFFDKAGKLLAKHGFKPNFDSTHGKPRNVAGLSLLYAAPQGTRTVRVQRKGATLYQATCDQAAPAISRFEVGAGRNDERSVTWTAKSRAGRKLFYRLAFGRDQKQFPITTAIGVPATRWTLPERFMPAADNASVTLYASDGCNVASARRDQVKIPARAPVVAITSMQPLPGGGIRVVAVAYDYTDGLLTGSALQWSVDGRPAGSGEAIDVITRPEDRHVSVTAMNAARLEGHATVDIPLGR